MNQTTTRPRPAAPPPPDPNRGAEIVRRLSRPIAVWIVAGVAGYFTIELSPADAEAITAAVAVAIAAAASVVTTFLIERDRAARLLAEADRRMLIAKNSAFCRGVRQGRDIQARESERRAPDGAPAAAGGEG